MNISESIKSERKKKNLTQKELALRIGKSERMVQKYESGEVVPSVDVLNEIGKILGLFIFYFPDKDQIQEAKNHIAVLINDMEEDLQGSLILNRTSQKLNISVSELVEPIKLLAHGSIKEHGEELEDPSNLIQYSLSFLGLSNDMIEKMQPNEIDELINFLKTSTKIKYQEIIENRKS